MNNIRRVSILLLLLPWFASAAPVDEAERLSWVDLRLSFGHGGLAYNTMRDGNGWSVSLSRYRDGRVFGADYDRKTGEVIGDQFLNTIGLYRTYGRSGRRTLVSGGPGIIALKGLWANNCQDIDSLHRSCDKHEGWAVGAGLEGTANFKLGSLGIGMYATTAYTTFGEIGYVGFNIPIGRH